MTVFGNNEFLGNKDSHKIYINLAYYGGLNIIVAQMHY